MPGSDGAPLPVIARIHHGKPLLLYVEDNPANLRLVQEIVKLHLVPGLGRHRLAALRPDHVQQFYAIKLDVGLAPQTVHHYHAVLHRALHLFHWTRDHAK